MKRGEVSVLLFSLLIICSTLAFAQEGETTTSDIDETFVDPGTSPDSILYTLDLFLEDVRLALATSHEAEATLEAAYLDERFAEMHAMIQDGAYSEAQEAADAASVILEDFHEDIQGIAESGGVTYNEFTSSEDTSLHDFIELHDDVIDHSNYAEAIDNELQEAVNAGEIGEEDADTLIEDLREESVEEEAVFSELEEVFVEDVAERSGVTTLEVSLEVEEEEEEEGIADTVKEGVSEANIEELRADVIELEEKVEQTKEAGEDTTTEEVLLENALLKLQICEAALAHGDYGKAHGQFTAAEHLVLNADRFYSDTRYRNIGDEERDRMLEGLQTYEDIKEIREKIAEENRRNVEEYERKKDELIQKYPDRAEVLQRMYEESKKVQEVAEKLAGEYDTQYEQLVAEGKSEEEATLIVTERFADEFRKSYGEDYIPPGFIDINPEVEIIPIGRIDKIDDLIAEGKVEVGGGFLEQQEYIDPATGYKYEFKKDGYTYTTPIGIMYEEKYPEGFVDNAKGYLRGDEVHEYKVETDEGAYEYKYSAVGYEIIKPDGSKEEYSYQPGTYKSIDGATIENKPTGFVCDKSGTKTSWEYNPEYSNYMEPSTGKVYTPDVSVHVEQTHYEADKDRYIFGTEGEGTTWTYKGSGTWESSSGEIHKAPATTLAPVGHEEKAQYITPEGVTWTYKSGTWESSTGEKYVPSPNQYYYVEKDGSYVDEEGHVYESPTTGEGTHSGYTDPSGKSWSYDTGTNTWTSSTGETYNPTTGETSGTTTEGTTSAYGHYESSTGEHTSSYGGTYTVNVDGSYTYTPSTTTTGTTGTTGGTTTSSGTWTQNSDGSWTSSTGETHTSSPSGTSTESTTTSTGSTTTTSTGDTGSYSGGTTTSTGGTTSSGGGSYSGGDTGGHTGGDSGGH